MTQAELDEVRAAIPAADAAAMDAARRRQAELAKPPGSLGELENISVRLAGITGRILNRIEKCLVTVLAADNGVVAEGVSSAPQSVTLAQAINMTRHKTGMSVLAACFGNEVQVVDVGIASAYSCPEILNRRIRPGTADFLTEPAMTRQEALDAMLRGTNVSYTVQGSNIVLKNGRSEAEAKKPAVISGVVRDAAGNPVVGAAVVVKGTTIGISTDSEGRFSLQVPPPLRRPFWKSTIWGMPRRMFGSAAPLASTLRSKRIANKSRMCSLSAIRPCAKATLRAR